MMISLVLLMIVRRFLLVGVEIMRVLVCCFCLLCVSCVERYLFVNLKFVLFDDFVMILVVIWYLRKCKMCFVIFFIVRELVVLK